MRRIAILAISLLAALPVFSQTAPAPAAAPPGAPAAAPTGPHPKTAAENSALVVLMNAAATADQASTAAEKATASDAVIKAADEFLKTYPDTDYKGAALMVEAGAYHDKRDEPKAIVAGEQSLEADPKNVDTLLLMAEIYSRTTRNTDLDMEDRLTNSDKYAKEVLALIAVATKPKADLPDAEWDAVKKHNEAQAWMAMGLAAIVRKKFDDAKTDLQKTIDLYPNPLDMLYIERAYIAAKRYDDAVVWTDKVAALPNANDQLKTIAASDKTRAQALKKQQSQ